MKDYQNRTAEPPAGNLVLPQNYSKNHSAGNGRGEKLRIAIVDDEALARRALKRAMERRSDIEIVGECSNGSEAVMMIEESHPDLIFLDVEMPQLNGFEVVERMNPHDVPQIVFVTAHEQYALDAFKVHAVDFLVKPIREEKIDDVLRRASRMIEQTRIKEMDLRLHSILQILGTRESSELRHEPLERIPVKNKGRIYFVETSSVDWIQADGNYITLHTGFSKHLIRMKMNCMEERLDPKIFLRIHRSTIVNIHSIKELRPYFSGAYTILLQDDTKIYSSRGHRKQVEHILNYLT
ncbi:MAG: DNA-binding response regulator [Ignavibacteriae bacterium]|nr:MAG: DNA-binding response regulator [Ignavibacteriota bacterium]